MTIHVGLIGAGNISDTHARAAAAIAGVKLTAVHAPTRDHAVRLASAHGATAYDTLDAFLDHRPMDHEALRGHPVTGGVQGGSGRVGGGLGRAACHRPQDTLITLR